MAVLAGRAVFRTALVGVLLGVLAGAGSAAAEQVLRVEPATGWTGVERSPTGTDVRTATDLRVPEVDPGRLQLQTRVERLDGEQGGINAGDEVILRTRVVNDGERQVPAGRLMLIVPVPAEVRLLPGSEGPAGAEIAYSTDDGRSWQQSRPTSGRITTVRYVQGAALDAGEAVTFWLHAEVP